MLKYPSLMCDEAGGCGVFTGNFRGVCPINGRQRIQNRIDRCVFKGRSFKRVRFRKYAVLQKRRAAGNFKVCQFLNIGRGTAGI